MHKIVTELIDRAAGLTDVGCVRERNEDAFLIDVKSRIFVVADGVGGHSHGDIAARMVTELLPQIIRRRVGETLVVKTSGAPMIRKMLGESLSELSRRIRGVSQERIEYKNMGAAVVVALLTANHAHIAHMGDSRAYLFRSGELRQLTEDHSVVALLVHHGDISPEEAVNHPARGRLTRFVGMEADTYPSIQTTDLQPDDRLLLCSDGLWGMLPKEQVKSFLTQRNDPEMTCRALVAAGKAAGGKDNLTAIMVDIFQENPLWRSGE